MELNNRILLVVKGEYSTDTVLVKTTEVDYTSIEDLDEIESVTKSLTDSINSANEHDLLTSYVPKELLKYVPKYGHEYVSVLTSVKLYHVLPIDLEWFDKDLLVIVRGKFDNCDDIVEKTTETKALNHESLAYMASFTKAIGDMPDYFDYRTDDYMTAEQKELYQTALSYIPNIDGRYVESIKEAFLYEVMEWKIK